MKRTYLPSELPEAKTEEEAVKNILTLASGKGFNIKNPYADDFFDLRRMKYGLIILNKLIKGELKELPNGIKKFKIPKIFEELIKEIENKMINWKI